MTGRFDVAGGAVIGKHHTLAGRGGQDAFAFYEGEAGLAAVVCDGCSSGGDNEVGAKLGAKLLVKALYRTMSAGRSPWDDTLWKEVWEETLSTIEKVTRGMDDQEIAEMFLFTVVGVAVGERDACLFAAGDGVVAVGEEVIELGPFEGNAPPYPAYALLRGSARDASLLTFRRELRADELTTALVGTDGVAGFREYEDKVFPGTQERVGPLASFWREERYFKNKDAVRRRLQRMNNSKPGLLDDDAAVVVVRRR